MVSAQCELSGNRIRFAWRLRILVRRVRSRRVRYFWVFRCIWFVLGMESSLNMQHQSNQTRYKQIDTLSTINSQQPLAAIQMVTATPTTATPTSGEAMHKSSDTDKDTSKLMHDIKHGCGSDTENVATAPTPSITSNKTKTPMCLVNELVRANQVNMSAHWSASFV